MDEWGRSLYTELIRYIKEVGIMKALLKTFGAWVSNCVFTTEEVNLAEVNLAEVVTAFSLVPLSVRYRS